MKSKNKIWFSVLPLLFTFISQPISAATAGDKLDAVVQIMLVITILVIAFVLWLAVVYSEKNDVKGKTFLGPIYKFFVWITCLTPIEKENDILFHHDFDGIRELDNKVPPWFNFLFYGTIVWGIIYMLVFHVFGDGQVQATEYKMEIQQAALEREIMIKSGTFLNEENVTLLTDAAGLSEGKAIFQKNCVSCHAIDGGGLVGPNLTDDYFIHGNEIKNIFKTIKYGVPAKGMIAWQTQLDPNKMQQVASYVISFLGTKPLNPKAPEGTKWEEQKADSIKTILK
ncbi:MAG: cbb3-type cytochrome c oxidase N-terminal domain-containing protein [Melioribacteraceae bacterium]